MISGSFFPESGSFPYRHSSNDNHAWFIALVLRLPNYAAHVLKQPLKVCRLTSVQLFLMESEGYDGMVSRHLSPLSARLPQPFIGICSRLVLDTSPVGSVFAFKATYPWGRGIAEIVNRFYSLPHCEWGRG